MDSNDATLPLRLLLALDSSFEQLAAVSLLSFLRHTPIESVLVVTPADTHFVLLPSIAQAFGLSLEHIRISQDSPTRRLPPTVRPYFYCIDAIQAACQGKTGRYLYVDADTLCVRNINELAALELSFSKPIAACSHGRPMHDRALILELDSAYHYFNAGVMLFDSEKLAATLNAEMVVAHYEKNHSLCRFREQCTLNHLLRGKVRYLPGQYNYLSWMRNRLSHSKWHDERANPMAYCLTNVREELGVAHMSAGRIPNRVSSRELEEIDRYWIELDKYIREAQLEEDLVVCPDYTSFSSAI